ncbi:uncharacterized protein [Apostichopus japonicus]|uniref:uncharacterized protein n=1 Tax=Stichopus japonicus TaxID=307972 RepID=UPI003AB2BFEC
MACYHGGSDVDLTSGNDADPTTVSFVALCDSKAKSTTFDMIKINGLPEEYFGCPLLVQFNIRGSFVKWSFETKVKSAREDVVTWQEPFYGNLSAKKIKSTSVILTLRRGDGSQKDIGVARFKFADINVDQKTLYLTSFDEGVLGRASYGQLVFSVRPTRRGVDVKIVSAENLKSSMKTYMVVAGMKEGKARGQTSAQRNTKWNETLQLIDNNFKSKELILYVVGMKNNEKQVLGQYRCHLNDITVFDRVVSLQEAPSTMVCFTMNVCNAGEKRKLEIKELKLKQMTMTKERTRVYVQIKRIRNDVTSKKNKTPKITLTKNPSFGENLYTFTVKPTDEFIFTVKTHRSLFTTHKPVIGKVDISSLVHDKLPGEDSLHSLQVMEV